MDNQPNNKSLNGKGISFVHLNARSLLNNIDLVRLFLMNNKVSVCTISETWLTNNIPNKLIEIDGFNIIRNDRTTISDINSKVKRGGGLLTYITKQIEIFAVIPDLAGCDNNLESQWIEI